MESQSNKDQNKTTEEMEKLISDWQTYGKMSKKEKPMKLVRALK
jgi:hypothetical protein